MEAAIVLFLACVCFANHYTSSVHRIVKPERETMGHKVLCPPALRPETLVVCATCAVLSFASYAQASLVSFTQLGNLPETSIPMSPSSISADGSVIVGGGMGSANRSEAAYWTAATGVQRMGDTVVTGSPRSFTYGVSGNGQIAVGTGTYLANSLQATRAQVGQPIQSLYGPPTTGSNAKASAASFDGSVVVGVESTPGGQIAFRWTADTGRQFLGPAVGQGYAFSATSVSHDGAVIVGRIDSVSPSEGRAFRWTSATGIVTLPDLPGGAVLADAYEVSADGSVIVGTGTNSFGRQVAVRWDLAGNVFALGSLASGTQSSVAFGVSCDGSIIVGRSMNFDVATGFVWTPESGMQPATTYLSMRGVALPGWSLTSVSDISADGQTLTGMGVAPGGVVSGWVATIPAPGVATPWVAACVLVHSRRRRAS